MNSDGLLQILDKAMYTVLRTNEQLGYVVCATTLVRWGVSGLMLIVQVFHRMT